LLNRLLGFDRAIVSATPGTTRDVVEEGILLRGWALRLIDTAGIRESQDPVEQEGILRAQHQRQRADLLLHVEDATLPQAEGFEDTPPDCAVVHILNKIDLGEHPARREQNAVRISCASGLGMDALQNAIEHLLEEGNTAALPTEESGGFVAINARHQDCLRRAREAVEAGRNAFDAQLSPEFIAEEIRGALEAVGDIVGRVDTEDLLGEIFNTFCIGK
jgi:tRNA modification GTPase